jgi:hypothetical protein
MPVPFINGSPKQEYEVTPLELFFDLVFVFAVSQLSHHLLTHLSWRGAVEALVMLLAIFTSMVFNKLVGYHDPGRSIPDPLVGLGGHAARLARTFRPATTSGCITFLRSNWGALSPS